ncbi:ATP-dependent bile acid permease [Xylariales sp. PMI_506]|nr:ATP-dependent bile acid permease [Xylariales sp. PMI_506]
MAGDLGSCSLPIWRVDDFTPCFRSQYLQILFPVIIASLSLVHLAVLAYQRISHSRRAAAAAAVANGHSHPHDHTELPAEEVNALDDEEEQIAANGITSGGRITLVKTTAAGTIIQADTPPHRKLSLFAEALAILGLIAIDVVTIASSTNAGRGSIVGVIFWGYVLTLVSLRFVLGEAPRVWNHTAAIYAVQWLINVVLFRSFIIGTNPTEVTALPWVQFGLVTFLFVLAMTSRIGNRTVLVEWQGEIEPSPEPLASIFSQLTFSWVDILIWKGYWAQLKLESVWNLLPSDKSAHILAEYRQMKKTTKLVWHYGKFLKTTIIVQALWAILGGILTYAPTLLLKAILECLEQRDSGSRNLLWLYVLLLPVADFIRSMADGQAMWVGRRIGIRARAIIIGDIFAKALRRKVGINGKEAAAVVAAAAAASEDAQEQSGKETKLDALKRWVGFGKKTAGTDASAAAEAEALVAATPAPATEKQPATAGTIINLMSIDSFKVGETVSHIHYLIAMAPTQLIVCIVLLYAVMGLSALPGFAITLLLLPLNIAIARGFHSTQKQILAATDKRINITNEVMQNIRIIKYFAWEQRFSDLVDEQRKAELKALRAKFLLWSFGVAIWNTVPVFITFFSFLVYTKVEGKPLYPSIAFTAISLFMLLRVPLDVLSDMIAHVQSAKVSVDRVEEFLSEEDTLKYEQLSEEVGADGERVLGFRDATLTWGSENAASSSFQLLNLNCEFKVGKLNIIAGATGSGKTSLLMALLGELRLVQGSVFFPCQSREDVRVNPATGLADTCAYAAQTAWLLNTTIRENILFSSPFDEKRYRDVILACGLKRDLEILDEGDETLVGEKGVSLSGGQKQRISLARAVYSDSRHLILDDCLSAVDSHTAQWIFTKCLKGPLMKDRTCILVTHNVTLCIPRSDYVVVMDNGRIAGQGTPAEITALGVLGQEIRLQQPTSDDEETTTAEDDEERSEGSTAADPLIDDGGHNGTLGGKPDDKKNKPEGEKRGVEKQTEGSIKWPVIKMYLTAMGPWWFWALALVVFVGQQMCTVASNLWIKEWANQYSYGAEQSVPAVEFGAMHFSMGATQGTSASVFPSIATYSKDQSVLTAAGEFSTINGRGAVAEVDINYYLIGLALIGITTGVVTFFRDLWVFLGSLTASWKLHNRLMAVTTRAKFRFFDSTPLGQIINRFSTDLGLVDLEMAPVTIGIMTCCLTITSSVAIIASITPAFLIAAVFIAAGYFAVCGIYLHVSRDLKRLDAICRSPLFQQFGEALGGVTTIRAYGMERRFVRENLVNVDTQARPFLYLWAANRWLGLRTDVLSELVSFAAGVFVILSPQLDAGAAGIVLSYAIGFSTNILWLVRLTAQNEQNMLSVERVKDYLDVEQEGPAITDVRPPPTWPARGAVEFKGYSTRYREDLDPVLKNVTFTINPLEKVGIVGRTGAGKSSLALTLFRALEAETGKILVDGIDISKLGLKDLREAITMVPQDPTLFTGTIRSNMDPFDLYSDEEIFEALRRVQLIGDDESPVTPVAISAIRQALTREGEQSSDDNNTGTSTPTSSVSGNANIFLDLSSTVAEGGSNLSQGQRQLLCLARAMLKKPRVLIMDEATASIDYATDAKIQGTIRQLEGTTITIAHRLATIVDYDKVLVLDHGAVVEYAHPWELLQNEEGRFRGMCESSGDLEALMRTAEMAFESKRLINVD